MANQLYPYRLEPYKGPATRHTCPSCKKKRQFVRYINTSTKEPLRHDVGRSHSVHKSATALKHMKRIDYPSLPDSPLKHYQSVLDSVLDKFLSLLKCTYQSR